MQKNIAGQTFRVFAFDKTTNDPVSGDEANITMQIRKDGGSLAPSDDTNPGPVAGGDYEFNALQAETNANVIDVFPVSSTANVLVIGVPGRIVTTPPNHSNMGIESDGDLTKVNLCQTNNDMRGTDGASTHTAADVWAVSTRTLSSFGTLIADIWANATRTLTAIVSGAATEAKQDAIISSQSLQALDSTVSKESTLNSTTSSIITDIAEVKIDTGSDIPAQITGLNNLSASEVNSEVVDVMNVDTYDEPGQGAPGSDISIFQKIGYLYKAFRNKKEQTTTELSIYNAAGDTVDQKSEVSGDAVTLTKSQFTTGA